MRRLKVMTIVGTRPEIIRLALCIKAMDKYFEHILVHTGQNWNYSLNQIFFDELGIREPDYYLDCVGDDLGETIGNIISKSYKVLVKEKPDAVLILGDTNSALSAISAKRLKIPIFHMEAGNRCWDWNVVETINRKIVDHIADINLPYTENARKYLLSEGIDGKTIYVTGSPMSELFKKYRDQITESDILERLGLDKKKYFLVSAHREENIDIEKNFLSLMNALNNIAEKYQMPILYSMHPRSRKYVEERNFKFHPLIRISEPFSFFEYNNLQLNSYCVLSDSGTLAEECSILGFDAVSLRTSTERPEALDSGMLILGGITQESIEQAIEIVVAMREEHRETQIPADYAEVNVSGKIVKIIQSYTEIVNKTVWLKYD